MLGLVKTPRYTQRTLTLN